MLRSSSSFCRPSWRWCRGRSACEISKNPNQTLLEMFFSSWWMFFRLSNLANYSRIFFCEVEDWGATSTLLTNVPLLAENASTAPSSIRFLISNVAAGSVIGKGGATISDYQAQSGARIHLSRNHEYFPGTTDRIISISGIGSEVLMALHLILRKILNEVLFHVALWFAKVHQTFTCYLNLESSSVPSRFNASYCICSIYTNAVRSVWKNDRFSVYSASLHWHWWSENSFLKLAK